jgi:hypothetical protein
MALVGFFSAWNVLLTSSDLPRPVSVVKYTLLRLTYAKFLTSDTQLSTSSSSRTVATTKSRPTRTCVRAAPKSYDCSFEDYFQDRTFVDPLVPTQGEDAAPAQWS